MTTRTRSARNDGAGTTSAPFGPTVATLALVGMVVVGQLYVTIPLMPQIGATWHTSQETAAWRSVFWGTAPLLALGAVLIWKVLLPTRAASRPARRRRVPPTGSAG